jgi:hypothetical protein
MPNRQAKVDVLGEYSFLITELAASGVQLPEIY